MSPSVWFPGWIDYTKTHIPKTEHIYLSLGDKEEKAKNPLMARVGDCIREQYSLLRDEESVKTTTLVWNEGNHFKDPEERSAKGFAWCIEQLQ